MILFRSMVRSNEFRKKLILQFMAIAACSIKRSIVILHFRVDVSCVSPSQVLVSFMSYLSLAFFWYSK